MNQPSLAKFEPGVKPGGLLIYEKSTIIQPPTRDDITFFDVPANMEAIKLNNKKTMNMIILGTFLGTKPILKIESILEALTKVLPERHHSLIPVNEKALRRGMELVAGK